MLVGLRLVPKFWISVQLRLDLKFEESACNLCSLRSYVSNFQNQKPELLISEVSSGRLRLNVSENLKFNLICKVLV